MAPSPITRHVGQGLPSKLSSRPAGSGGRRPRYGDGGDQNQETRSRAATKTSDCSDDVGVMLVVMGSEDEENSGPGGQ